MSGSGTVAAEPPPIAAPAIGGARSLAQIRAGGRLPHAPAAFFLLIWVVYPTVRTIFKLFDKSGDSFVWSDNYKQIFTNDVLLTAVENNFIWIAIVPALVHHLRADLRRPDGAGQLVGRLQDRGLHANGHLGLRSGYHVAHRVHPGSGPGRAERRDCGGSGHGEPARCPLRGEALVRGPGRIRDGGLTLKQPLKPGEVALLGLTAVAADEVPKDAKQAAQPEPLQGGMAGDVVGLQARRRHARKSEAREDLGCPE